MPASSSSDTGRRPVALIVRDGWGRNPHPELAPWNAITRAQTPVANHLLTTYPWSLIKTSGEDVGLPEGTMGNSEVGHQNLGAGRIVNQESVRITKAVRDGAFFENPALVKAVEHANARDGAVHVLGIASDAGVHGMLDHLYACLELCQKRGHSRVFVHLFTDGRDTGPYTGVDYVEQVEDACRRIGVGRVATLVGRYWAMDRDNRWQRVERAYNALSGRSADLPHFDSAAAAVQDFYDHPEDEQRKGDEFVTPRTVGAAGDNSGISGNAKDSRIQDGDSVIFVNYRGDRPRELVRAFRMPDFYGHVAPSPDSGERGFERGPRLDINFVTMTAYQQALDALVSVAFPKPPKMRDIGATYLADLGLRQFRCAETEKFPHVTFFWNDYRDAPVDGEQRYMAQSPSVSTYDQQPEMSAREVCNAVLERLEADDCEDFILVNFANADMVGHTGSLDATISAVETVDAMVGEIIDQLLKRGGSAIVTADHGNAEQMWDPKTKAPHTAHTTYDVECIVVDEGYKHFASGSANEPSKAMRTDGRLADVFPSLLELLGVTQPDSMTGRSLFD